MEIKNDDFSDVEDVGAKEENAGMILGMNKKLFYIILALICVIIIVIIVVLCVVLLKDNGSTSTEEEEEKDEKLPDTIMEKRVFQQISATEIDKNNSRKTTKWTKVYLRDERQYKLGLPGGEGCQWPTGLAIEPNDGNLVLYGTDVAGIYKSTDGGDVFYQSNSGLLSRGVGMAAIDPRNSSHIIALGQGAGAHSTHGTIISFDQGRTWERTKEFRVVGDRYTITGMAFDNRSYSEEDKICKVAYFSTPYIRDSGVRSGDSTYNAKSKSGLNAETSGLYKTTDGGLTWDKIQDLPDCYVRVNPLNSDVYVGNYNGLYYSNDQGENFEQINDVNITGLDLVVHDGEALVYYQTTTAVFKSKSAKEFEEIECDNYQKYRFAQQITVAPSNPNYMMMTARIYGETQYYSTYAMYSHNGGKTWTKWTTDVTTTFVTEPNHHPQNREKIFAFNPKNESIVFTFGGDYLMRSDDGGITFYGVPRLANIMVGSKINFNYYNPNVMYFGAQDYAGAKTLNGGEYWTPVIPINNLTNKWVGNDYGCFAANDNTLISNARLSWGGAYENFIYVSHDGGKTFTNTSLILDQSILSHAIQVLQSLNDPNILFDAQYRSDDNGYTWKEMNGCRCACVVSPGDPHEIYGFNINSSIIVVSYDDGITWKEVNPDKPFFTENDRVWDIGILDMAFDHINRILYIPIRTKWGPTGSYEGFRFIRLNVTSGESKDIIGNMPGRRFYSAAVDPNYVNLVYAGGSGDYYTNQNSVQRSFDFGETWQVLTTNPTNSILNDTIESYGYEAEVVRVNPINGELLVGTNCFGFYTLSPPYDPSLIKEKITKHRVVFKTNGGINIPDQYIDNRNSLTYIEPKKEDFMFDGWYTDSKFKQEYDFSLPVTNSFILYAKWVPYPDVKLMVNGKLYKTIPFNDEYEAPVDVESPKEGYAFKRWYMDSSLTKPYTQPDEKIEMTLYAAFIKVASDNLYNESSADNTNYFIRYGDQQFFNYSGDNEASIRMEIEPSTKYYVSLKMGARFRIGFAERKEPYGATPALNYVIHNLDVNGKNETNTYEELVAESPSDSNIKYMFIYYWTSTMVTPQEEIRETIKIYKLVSNDMYYLF